jgi:hypothetical protein
MTVFRVRPPLCLTAHGNQLEIALGSASSSWRSPTAARTCSRCPRLRVGHRLA